MGTGLFFAAVSISSAQVGIPQIPKETWAKITAIQKPVTSTVPPPTVAPAGQTIGRPALRTKAPTPRSLQAFFNEYITNRIDISGRRTLAYRAHSVEGDREAFNTLNYYGQGGDQFSDQGQMNISGRKVFGFVDFNMQVADNRLQDPDQRRVTLNFDGHPYRLTYGDINGSLLNTNRFARFNRLLNGAMVDYNMGRLQARAVRSQSRGAARTVSIPGNNSSGPYYLQSGRVRPDTIEVQVNGETVRLGTDYELDSDLGAITFINRIISPTSVIVATYESAAFNEQTGTIQGAGISYNFGKFGTIGASLMEQVGSGASSASSKIELFQGQGVPTVGYDLDYEPIPGTVQIRVGAIIQIQGVDFNFDATYPRRFYMTRYIDPSQTVSATYRPKVIQTVTGDRRVTGIDWLLPFVTTDAKSGRKTDLGYFKLSQARGDAVSDGIGGVAQGADWQYRKGPFNFTGGVRDIPAEFVSIESRGFNRNEKATELGLEYNLGPWGYGVKTQNSLVTTRQTVNGTTETRLNRFTTTTGSARYREVDGMQWGLEHSRIRNRLQYDSALDTTGITASKQFGRLTANFAVENQSATGPTTSATSTPEIASVALQSFRTGLQWDASKNFRVSSRASLSKIDRDGENSDGSDVSIGAEWQPTDRWNVSTSYINSNSGSISTLGNLNSGAGIGYGGNGFSSGGLGDSINLGNTTLRSFQTQVSHRASDRFNLSLRAYQTGSFGDLSSNSETRAYGAGVEWDLGRQTLFSFSLDQTDTSYGSGLTNAVKGTSYTVGLSGSPPGRLNFAAILAGALSSGGTSQFGQDSLSYELSMGYRMNDRNRLIFALTNARSSGYYGQLEQIATLGYEYRIFRNIGLQALYRFRDVSNTDATLTSGNYRSRGLDIELTFNFLR